jgi:hypothetical protein
MSVRSVLSPDKDKNALLKFATSEVEQLSDAENVLHHIIIDFLMKLFHNIDSLIEFRTYAEGLCSGGDFMGFYVGANCPIVVFGTFKTITGVLIIHPLFLGIDGRCSAFQESLRRCQKSRNPCLLGFARFDRIALGGSRFARRQPPDSVQHAQSNAKPVDIAYFGIDFSQTSPTLLGKKKLREAGRSSQECGVGFGF